MTLYLRVGMNDVWVIELVKNVLDLSEHTLKNMMYPAMIFLDYHLKHSWLGK